MELVTAYNKDTKFLINKVSPVGATLGTGFGRWDASAFYGYNYSTAQHIDKDASWSVANTLEKEDCPDLAGSFAYSEWGTVVVTQENTVWYGLVSTI
jgi:hypothetical protein